MNQNEKILKFRKLHSAQSPLILLNIWDEKSADMMIKQASHNVIATSSWAMAKHFGYEDGENIPFELLLRTIKKIYKANDGDLLISVDIETGYADSLNSLKDNIKKLIDCGIIGINIEDKVINYASLYDMEEQGKRISAIKECSENEKVEIFINARTDTFFLGDIL